VPRLRIFVRRLEKPFIVVLLWAFSIPLCLSQTAGRVDNVQQGNALALVSGVLQARHHGLQKVEMDTHDLISNFEEFRSYFLPYRAHYRFHLEGNSLLITMEDLQSLVKGNWNPSLIPANGAEAKLIAQMVDQLNSANRQVANSQDSRPVRPNPLPGPPPDNAKSLIFDPSVTRCAEGMCSVRRDGLWGFIDYDGNLVLDFQYHSDTPPYFSRGTCVVGASYSGKRQLNGYFYINKNGSVLFGNKVFAVAHPFIDEVTTVTLVQTGAKAVLDLEGHLLLSKDVPDGDFHEGLIAGNGPGGIGFRNAKMQWAVTPKYPQAQAFSEGIAWVVAITPGGASKWGAINKEGKTIIPFMFSQAPEPFSDGLALVTCTDGKFGYVDTAGKLAIPCQYSKANRFVRGHALVVSSNGEQLIDKQGNVVVDGKRIGISPAGVSSLTLREDGLYSFREAYHGLLDGDGDIVIPPNYLDVGLFPADEDRKGLAWASLVGKSGQISQGFINHHGEFILMQEQSTF
jgi:hypothetical protein